MPVLVILESHKLINFVISLVKTLASKLHNSFGFYFQSLLFFIYLRQGIYARFYLEHFVILGSLNGNTLFGPL